LAGIELASALGNLVETVGEAGIEARLAAAMAEVARPANPAGPGCALQAR